MRVHNTYTSEKTCTKQFDDFLSIPKYTYLYITFLNIYVNITKLQMIFTIKTPTIFAAHLFNARHRVNPGYPTNQHDVPHGGSVEFEVIPRKGVRCILCLGVGKFVGRKISYKLYVG